MPCRSCRAGAVVVPVLWLLVLSGSGSAAVAAEPDWTWPLAGAQEVSRPFAPPVSRYGAGHRGADLPGVAGAVVRAARAGRVSYAGLLAGRGVVVVVHGDLRTTYEPVTASVALGAVVPAGGQIGTLDAGHVGCPVAACLHWGLRRGEDYLDPVRLVDRGPARLLPLGDAVGAPAAGLAPDSLPAAPDPGAPGASGAAPPTALSGVHDPGASGARGTAPDAAAHALGDPPRAEEFAWSLRAAEVPLGLAALAALVAGIGLLARPRPDPDDPAAGGAAVAINPGSDRPGAAVLQLETERLRRRTG